MTHVAVTTGVQQLHGPWHDAHEDDQVDVNDGVDTVCSLVHFLFVLE